MASIDVLASAVWKVADVNTQLIKINGRFARIVRAGAWKCQWSVSSAWVKSCGGSALAFPALVTATD